MLMTPHSHETVTPDICSCLKTLNKSYFYIWMSFKYDYVWHAVCTSFWECLNSYQWSQKIFPSNSCVNSHSNANMSESYQMLKRHKARKTVNSNLQIHLVIPASAAKNYERRLNNMGRNEHASKRGICRVLNKTSQACLSLCWSQFALL